MKGLLFDVGGLQLRFSRIGDLSKPPRQSEERTRASGDEQ